jgi:hypothetical protein
MSFDSVKVGRGVLTAPSFRANLRLLDRGARPAR